MGKYVDVSKDGTKWGKGEKNLYVETVRGRDDNSTLVFHGYKGVKLFLFRFYHTCDYLSRHLSVSLSLARSLALRSCHVASPSFSDLTF